MKCIANSSNAVRFCKSFNSTWFTFGLAKKWLRSFEFVLMRNQIQVQLGLGLLPISSSNSLFWNADIKQLVQTYDSLCSLCWLKTCIIQYIIISVRFLPVWQRLYFLFGCHGLLCLPVMLLFDVASPYISSIMRGDASLAGRSAVSHDGSWIRVTQGDSERLPALENQF